MCCKYFRDLKYKMVKHYDVLQKCKQHEGSGLECSSQLYGDVCSPCAHMGFSWVLLFYQRHARLFVLPSPLKYYHKADMKVDNECSSFLIKLGLVGVCMECSLLLALC